MFLEKEATQQYVTRFNARSQYGKRGKHVHSDRESDQIEKFERAHGVPAIHGHAKVLRDRINAANRDPLPYQDHRLREIARQNPVDEESWSVADYERKLAQPLRQAGDLRQGLLGREGSAHHLDQLHFSDGIEEVESNAPFGKGGLPRNVD